MTDATFTPDPDALTRSVDELGWVGRSPDDPDVVALRAYLEANNGLRGLEILEPDEAERATELFHRDGFVVVGDILDDEQIDRLRRGCEEVIREIASLDGDRIGNRGSHRYSFGASSTTGAQMHRPEWQMLIDLPLLTPIISAIFGSPNYMLRAGSGDFCLPGAVEYQQLHADTHDRIDVDDSSIFSFRDHRHHLSIRDLPVPYVCANFIVNEMTTTNGATRQIPGTHHSRSRFPTLDEEPEWMRLSTICPAPAGAVLIRDVRAWHGGTPNVSDHVRSLPNVEFFAPWYREPIRPCLSRRDYEALSDHGKRVARFSVIDSSKELRVGYQIGPTPSTTGRITVP